MGKSKKQQAYEVLEKYLSELAHVESESFASVLVEAIEIMIGKPKKKGEKTDGALVWETYEKAVMDRHNFKPARNATTNNQASQLVSRLGFEDAIAVVQFYLKQNDAFYVKNLHPLGFCLKDAEPLFGRMKSGTTITRQAAQKIESAGATLSASSTYLNRKYGQASLAPEGENK